MDDFAATCSERSFSSSVCRAKTCGGWPLLLMGLRMMRRFVSQSAEHSAVDQC